MKITVSLGGLREAVGWAAGALSGRPQHPVLGFIRLDATEDQIGLAAFDYDTAATMTLAASVGEPGTVLLSGRLVNELVGALSGETVQITSEGDQVELVCGKAVFTLRCPPLDEYPALPSAPPPSGTCAAAALADAFGRVLPAAGGPRAKPQFQAVHMEAGRQLIVEATNSYQAAMCELDWWADDPEERRALIPLPAAHLIRRMDEEVTICLPRDESQCAGFAGGPRQLVTRLIGGEYPVSVRNYFARPRPTTVTAPTGELVAALKAVGLMRDNAALAVEVEASDGELTVSIPGQELGAGAMPVAGATVEGPPVVTKFQPARLIAAAQAAGDQVRLALSEGPKKPALVSSGRDGDTYRQVVMPVVEPGGQ